MTDTKLNPGPLAIRAAVAIISSTVNPALRHEASNVTARHLAGIIERETHATELIQSLHSILWHMKFPEGETEHRWAVEAHNRAKTILRKCGYAYNAGADGPLPAIAPATAERVEGV